MKDHETRSIRNIAIVGHGHAGKTSLVEAMAFTEGLVQRLGTVAAGTTIADYGDDEHTKKLSIRLKLVAIEHGDVKLNLLDTPGFANFIYDAKVGLSVADAALVVVDAAHGVEVQTERTWTYANEVGVSSRLIVLTKMDRENVDFDGAVKAVVDRFGRTCVPVQVPIGASDKFRGVVDLLTRKAYMSAGDGSAAVKEVEVPADLADVVKRRREQLVEMIAEADEKLMEAFLEAGELSNEQVVAGLRQAVLTGALMPIACTSGTRVVGIAPLLDLLAGACPPPSARAERASADGESKRRCDDADHISIQVFKTLSDPYAGRLSLFRAWSGIVKSDATLMNTTRQHEERIGVPFSMRGKEQIKLTQVHVGDIACLAKLKDTFSGDTLADKAHPIVYAPLPVPEAMMSYALEAKNMGEEDKIAQALTKIGEEDLVLRHRLDPQTKEMIVAGAGDGHIEAVIERLRTRFKVEVVLHPPRVPYRETVTRAVADTYRHKKQTGGSGQFAEVSMELKPLQRGGGFEFDTKRVFGGAISNNFYPSIQKGIHHVLERGPLGGFPVVDVRCEVFDGKMHPVDSKDIAFQMAGRQLMKELMLKANPILLEPIMSVRVDVPIECMGDVMGDLSSRRGRVQGMDADGSHEVVKALVPLAEMLTYQASLKSMTGGRGDFTMELDHYDPVPTQIQDKILAGVKHVAEVEET
jgi:elongation factor G